MLSSSQSMQAQSSFKGLYLDAPDCCDSEELVYTHLFRESCSEKCRGPADNVMAVVVPYYPYRICAVSDGFSCALGFNSAELEGETLRMAFGPKTKLKDVKRVVTGKSTEKVVCLYRKNGEKLICSVRRDAASTPNEESLSIISIETRILSSFSALPVDLPEATKICNEDNELICISLFQRKTLPLSKSQGFENKASAILLPEYPYRIRAVSAGFASALGFQPAELKGGTLRLAFGPRTDLNQVRRAVTQQARREDGICLYRKDGEALVCSILRLDPLSGSAPHGSAAPIVSADNGGSPSGRGASVVDGIPTACDAKPPPRSAAPAHPKSQRRRPHSCPAPRAPRSGRAAAAKAGNPGLGSCQPPACAPRS